MDKMQKKEEIIKEIAKEKEAEKEKINPMELNLSENQIFKSEKNSDGCETQKKEKTKTFAHLHLHTEFSMLDGAVRMGELFARCDELGITSVAITDHGNMYGALEFVKAAVRHTDPKADPFDFIKNNKKFKVCPIVGCEFYTTHDMRIKTAETKQNNHLVLLAKNETGYKNLVKLCSIGFIEGMYYKPRIDFALLKQYSEGLVCLSACLAGVIPQCLLAGNLDGAKQWAQKYKTLFGDDFYIEIQDHRLAEQRRILPLLVSLAGETGIKLVATNDVHYLNREDALMQKVLQNISFQRTMSPDEVFQQGIVSEKAGDYFPTDEFYLKSADEMASLFGVYKGAVENTLEVAAKCECNFFRKEKLLPLSMPPEGKTPAEFLRELCYSGLLAKYGEITDEIHKRAEYELNIITSLGFVDYYLIVWDFINFAENNGVSVGPGRGSGVGSLVAYAVGITKVDPLKYSLIFERFLNSERVSNPDFDIDFCVDGREKVIKYVVDKYGTDNVSQIITFSTLAAKAAIKDVGRVFDRPYADVDRLTKLMPKMMGKSGIADLLGLKPPPKDGTNLVITELKDIYNDDNGARQIMDMAMRLEGMPRQTGMHAAGVIICKDEIKEHIPLARNADGIITTQFNMIECEELGLLKMDFLGLTTLTDISKALRYVKEQRGVDIDFYKMGYDDPEVFKLVSEGDTEAVFQLESAGMTRFFKDLKPTSLEDIIAGISLYRPGPMDKIGDYVKAKRNPEEIKYDHPLIEPILKVSYGIMIYQEQVMDAVRALAGYSLGRADIVRRMMSKKKHSEMEKEREVFLNGTQDGNVKGCIKNGVPAEVANKIFDDMTSFASYAFNKSHAAAYAYLAYQTAYLKRYYTVEFITAVLNNRITRSDEIASYLMYLKDKNIAVLPPDVNRSEVEFAVENGSVRVGLAALKNVGTGVVSVIVEERQSGGLFKDFEDFIKRMQTAMLSEGKNALGKKLLESLIYSGAFDGFGITRSGLISCYETVLDRIKKDSAASLSGQFSFFDTLPSSGFTYPNLPEYHIDIKLKMEKQVAGVYLSGHPLGQYSDKLRSFTQNTSLLKSEEDPPSYVTLGGMLSEASVKFTKSGREIGTATIEDLAGSAEIMITGDKLAKYRHLWKSDMLVTISGRVNVRDESGATLWVDRLEPWEIKKKSNKKMCIYFASKADAENNLFEIKDLLKEYAGADDVYISYNENGKKVLNLLDGTTALVCEMLKNELLGYTYIIDVKMTE